MFALLETLGETQQAQVGIRQLGQVVGLPFGALPALPDLKNLPSLMNDPLGKVLLETLAVGLF
ncbi:hypothetical protein D3C80_998410 [compost metagenome]